MFVFIIGGSASGKSELAEDYAVKMGKSIKDVKKLYIATMRPFDNECVERIERHQAMRAEKGFDTKEIYVDLNQYTLEKKYDVVLIECMSNILLNEIFCLTKDEFSLNKIIDGIDNIRGNFENVILVSNDIFSDDQMYSDETKEYIAHLGNINKILAEKADKVVEVVCGIPIVHKG